MAISLRRPSPGAITSPFGWRTAPKVGSTYHQGIDFGWGNGWTIYAAASGTIVFAGRNTGWGNLIRISHGNGVETWYAHQARFLKTSGWVNAGEPIGIIGNTGTSAGAHLHFELLTNGRRIDPMPYFTATAGGGGVIIIVEEENEMKLAFDTNGTGWLVTDEGWAGLPSMQVYNLFYRLIKSTPDKPDTFNQAEVDIMNSHIRLLALANNTQATIDPIKLASAISDALPGELEIVATVPEELRATLTDLGTVDWDAIAAGQAIDPELLADALDVAVPRIARALLKQQGQALANLPE